MNKLVLSLSPHVHGGDSVEKNMYGVCIALLPALLASFYFFGLGAVIVEATSVLACVFFEWAITKFLFKRERTTICDGSAVLTAVAKVKKNLEDMSRYDDNLANTYTMVEEAYISLQEAAGELRDYGESL